MNKLKYGMMTQKKIFLFFPLLWLGLSLPWTAYAQKFQWSRSFGTPEGYENFVTGLTEPDGNYVYIGNCRDLGTTNTTLHFDSFAYPVNAGIKEQISVICRVDPNGKVIKSKSLGKNAIFGGYSIEVITRDSLGNLYFPLNIPFPNTDSTYFNNQWYYLKNGNVLLVKMDKNFNVLWVKQFGSKTNYSSSLFTKLYAVNNRLYFIFSASLTPIFIGDSTYTNTQKVSSYYGELKSLDGSVKWCRRDYKNQMQDGEYNFYSITSLNNSVYFVGYNDTSRKVIGNDTFTYPCILIKKFSLDGTPQKVKTIGNSSKIYLQGFGADSSRLYIGLAIVDTFRWAGKTYLRQVQPSPYTGSFSEGVFACLDSNLNEQWFIRPKVYKNIQYSTFSSRGFHIANNFIYVQMVISNNFLIGTDTFRVDPSKTFTNYFVKMDNRGNILWKKKLYASGQGVLIGYSNISSNGKGSIYFGNTYSDTIQIDNLKDTSKGFNDILLLNLTDNSITRGYVKPGPYCAGDTIEIPYTRIGPYDTSNYFIAELSDENGDFTGNQKELGRLKSSNNGTIKGILPLFQVVGSDKYRIRIISTSPVVQSYFKYDTLRLLIYSRDNAYAGKDTTVCYGSNVILETKGGTKWSWSPSYTVVDSNARKTSARPLKTTTYQIIISDSSGCGKADTAFKTITVRSPLKAKITTPKDTTVCLNGSMMLCAEFSGGDSANYTCQWYYADQNGQLVFVQESSLKNKDSLLYTLPAGVNDSVNFTLYLFDKCTPASATAYYTLKVKKQAALAVFNFPDTSFCPGSVHAIVADFKGAPKNKLSWSWQENTFITNQWAQRRTGSNKQSDIWNYTLPLNWKGTKKIRILLNDACSGLKDTSVLAITPKDTLKISLNTVDTTLCYGAVYTWKASAYGGSSAYYKFIWTDINTGDTIGMSDSLDLIAYKPMKIQVKLVDGCMPSPASRYIDLKVGPPLKSSISNSSDSVVCFGKKSVYHSASYGGNGKYNYLWLVNNKPVSFSDSLNLINDGSLQKSNKIQLIVSDGCSSPDDTSDISVRFTDPISQNITKIDSLCNGSYFKLKSMPSGGISGYSFSWLANDVAVSSGDSLSVLNLKSGINHYKVVVSDACSQNDTSEFDIVFLSPLILNLNTPDSCPTSVTFIRSGLTGGKLSSRSVKWYNNTTLIGQGDSLSLNPSLFNNKTFKAIASDACSKYNDTASISIGSAPAVKIKTLGECLGDTTRFIARQTNSLRAISCKWTLNGSSLLGSDSVASNLFGSTGPYNIKVEVSSGGRCKGIDSLNGFILVKPAASFILAHFDRTAQGIPFKFIDQSRNGNTWLWNFGDGDTSQHNSPEHIFRDTGIARVKLIVSNQNKCFDSTEMTFPILEKVEFYFPNVFSPNGNNINESFGLTPNQWNKVKEFNLKIYNRWGEMVFDSDHMEQHWTGEGAQQGVYIYKVLIRDVYNVLHEQEGVVELLF